MKDRWVLVFTLFCLAQLPLYFILGRGNIGYDNSIKSAETALLKIPESPTSQVAVMKHSLEDCAAALKMVEGGGKDSRQARLDLNYALLSWNQGDMAKADLYFRKSIEEFESTHGPDGFHTSAVSLRYAEFLMLTRRYPEALARFELGVGSIEETMGPKNPFATRMLFRRVTLLTYMGRYPEAAKLGKEYLGALRENAGRFDEFFINQTGPILDILSREASFPVAPEGAGWSKVLIKDYHEGKARLAETPDEG